MGTPASQAASRPTAAATGLWQTDHEKPLVAHEPLEPPERDNVDERIETPAQGYLVHANSRAGKLIEVFSAGASRVNFMARPAQHCISAMRSTVQMTNIRAFSGCEVRIVRLNDLKGLSPELRTAVSQNR
jgi:hypothetical protein